MENDNRSEGKALDDSETSPDKLRVARIDELFRDALDNPDPRNADLIAGACAYMKFSAQLQKFISEDLVNSCSSLADMKKLAGPIELDLKMTRQYDRLVALATRRHENVQKRT
jgi:hypothetical protein